LHFGNAFGHDAAKTRPTGGLPPADAFAVRFMQPRNRIKVLEGRRMIRDYVAQVNAISNQIEQKRCEQ